MQFLKFSRAERREASAEFEREFGKSAALRERRGRRSASASLMACRWGERHDWVGKQGREAEGRATSGTGRLSTWP